MARIHANIFSETLGIHTSLVVVYPEPRTAQPDGSSPQTPPAPLDPPGVFYLLHGLSDDETMWTRRTSIERYAEATNVAVVMPAANRSFYTDMASGPRYEEFIAEEVPFKIARLFPVSTDRSVTYIAGLSMGGYGALKIGLKRPERFAAVGSFSGAVDMASRFEERTDRTREHEMIFGDLSRFAGSNNDTLALVDRLQPSDAPDLYLACGDEDFLLEDNRRFVSRLKEKRFSYTYDEDPGYGHSWDYWDIVVRRFMTFAGMISDEAGATP